MDDFKKLPPWKRRRKSGTKRRLTPAQIAAARTRAAAANRRYPNLVDNLWAAKLKPEDLAPKRDFDDFNPDADG